MDTSGESTQFTRESDIEICAKKSFEKDLILFTGLQHLLTGFFFSFKTIAVITCLLLLRPFYI